MTNMPQRMGSLDLVCCVLIIHMMWGHIALETGCQSWGKWVLAFFMPWFYFKAGMFFRPQADKRNAMCNDARRLLRPFVYLSLAGQVVWWIWLWVSGDTLLWHYLSFPAYLAYYGTIQGNTPLWFLSSLFFVKTFYNCIHGKANDWAVISISCAIGFALCTWLPSCPPIICSQPLGLAFLVLGVKLKTTQYNWRLQVIGFLLAASILLFCPSRVGVYGNHLLSGSYLLFILYALGSIIVANGIARFLLPLLERTRIGGILCLLGRHSMFFYTTHYLLLLSSRTLIIGLLGYSAHDSIYLLSISIALFGLLPLLWAFTRRSPLVISLFG